MPGADMVFFLAFLFHVVLDGLLWGFSVDAVSMTTRFIFYAFCTLFVWLKSKDNMLIGIAALELLVPYFLVIMDRFSGEPLMNFLTTLWWITPVFALYVASLGEVQGWFVKWWKRFWIVALFIIIIQNAILLPFFPQMVGQVDVKGAATGFAETLWDSARDVWEGLVLGIKKTPDRFTDLVNFATNNAYTSYVEDTQDEPVGMKIDRIRTSHDFFYVGEPVTLFADISGKSFKEEIRIHTSCATRDGLPGETTPENFVVFAEGYESVMCEFQNLSEDTRSVQFNADFNFETWSYVTYTFVNQDTLYNYLAQDKDINRDLHIRRNLKPIYTPGPVSIGMSSDVPQPVGMDDERGVNTPFGVTLRDIWTDGEIARVDEFVVIIPEWFKLEDCDTVPDAERIDSCDIDEDVCEEEMVGYSFKNIGAPKTFRTINCRLRDNGDLSRIVPPELKQVPHTFAVKAKYVYEMSKRKSIDVEEFV